MSSEIIDAQKLFASLEHIFDSVCDIEEASLTSGDYNTSLDNWSKKYQDVKCAYGPNQYKEKETETATLKDTDIKIILTGDYDVTNSMRVLLEGQYYDILQVQKGVLQIKTVLHCKRRQQ